MSFKEKVILPSNYLLGDEDWDSQHATIISLLKYLLESSKISPQKRAESVDEVLTELKKYAILHFAYERKKMEKPLSKEENEHVKEHKYFIREVEQMQRRATDGLNIVQEMAAFLSNWFQDHILRRDHELYASHEMTKAAQSKSRNSVD